MTLNNLAVTSKRRGAFAAAAMHYAEAIEIFEQSLGADHPKAVTCRANATRVRRLFDGWQSDAPYSSSR